MKILKESVDWSYYDKQEFDEIDEKYLPPSGEGETMASQIVTAVNKLVYKWYNDGDVYDNTHGLEGWANDLSDYANWLWRYADADVLMDIENARNDSDYENILKDLADSLLNDSVLDEYKDKPLKGSIYDCKGPFKFEEHWDDEEDEDDWYEDEEDEDW